MSTTPSSAPAHRVVDRRRRAPPAVLLGQEVLGREDLHGVIDLQRGPDRVRARAVLGPQHPLGEADPLDGVLLHALVPFEPQDPAGLVADDEHVLRVVGQRAQVAAQHRQDAGDRAVLARLRERVLVERALRLQALGVEPGALHPRPRLLDHRARAERAAFERGLPHPPEAAGVRPNVRAGVDGDERVARDHPPVSVRPAQRSRNPARRRVLTSVPTVGVIANPASGRDIRRLVAGASVFGNADKAGDGLPAACADWARRESTAC